MSAYDLDDRITKKNPWIRSIRKSSDVEEISNLIKKRFEFPLSTGPYIKNGEQPGDIISAMALHSDEYRNKITPAIGLILYKINEKVILPPFYDILFNAFYVVQDAKLKACRQLVFQWLNDNSHIAVGNEVNSKKLYKAGLLALIDVQDTSKDNEELWKAMWDDDDKYWWGTAYKGLQKQNPYAAAEQMERLVKRGEEYLYLIENGWRDNKSKNFIEFLIANGLHKKEKWSGIVLNTLIDKFGEDDRKALLASIQRKLA